MRIGEPRPGEPKSLKQERSEASLLADLAGDLEGSADERDTSAKARFRREGVATNLHEFIEVAHQVAISGEEYEALRNAVAEGLYEFLSPKTHSLIDQFDSLEPGNFTPVIVESGGLLIYYKGKDKSFKTVRIDTGKITDMKADERRLDNNGKEVMRALTNEGFTPAPIDALKIFNAVLKGRDVMREQKKLKTARDGFSL